MSASFALPESAASRGAAVRAWLNEQRTALCDAHKEGASAVEITRSLARYTDEVVTALFQAAHNEAPPDCPPVALVALGGLGRHELAPHSDVDLVLVSDAPDHEATRAFADLLFYPLWDARIEVGHAVRDVDAFAELAAQDDTVRTTAVDWRSLGGDAVLLERLRTKLTAALGRSESRRYVFESVTRWHAKGNPATIYQLQPDIKTGPGGLRELHRIWWVARIIWRIDAWEGLPALGLIDPKGYDALMRGRELLLGIRLALHFLAGRRQDQLRFDLQDLVAAHLGIEASASDGSAADPLLRTFYRHATAVRSASLRFFELCADTVTPARKRPTLRKVDGFHLFGDRLDFSSAAQLDNEPLDLLRIFRVAQRLRVALYVQARARIAEAAPRLIDNRYRNAPQTARLVRDLLSDPRGHGETLAVLHELGLLERLVPELSGVTGLVQRDLYHTYTIDAHLIYCAQRVLELLDGASEGAPTDIATIAQRIARPHVLVLGALFHDIGKGQGHGHAERGAIMARQAALRLRLGHEDVADVEFLVREHLTMFIISQRRDLEDPDLVARFAASVESAERLDMLVVLSYADAVTTGPEVWNDWKSALLRELCHRTRAALRGESLKRDLESRAKTRLEKVITLLGPEADHARRLAGRLQPRHLATYRTTLLVRHVQAAKRAAEKGCCCSIASDERRGGWEIVVVGPDRPGLLADISGVLAAWGVSVDAAYISGTVDGLAIDTVVVRPSVCASLESADGREKLARALEEAVLGRADYGPRMEERQRSERSRARRRRAPRPETRVIYELDAHDEYTVVELFAPDSIGLLHRVTEAIFREGASIVLARITTEGERAVDAFYLVNAETRKPLSQQERRRIERALRFAGQAP